MLVYSAVSTCTAELASFLFYTPVAAFKNHPVWMLVTAISSVSRAYRCNWECHSLAYDWVEANVTHEGLREPSKTFVKCLEGVMFTCFMGAIAFSSPSLTKGGVIWDVFTKAMLPGALASGTTFLASAVIEELGYSGKKDEIFASIGAAVFNMAVAFACGASWTAIAVGLAINLAAAAYTFATENDALGLINRPFSPVTRCSKHAAMANAL